MTHAPLALVDGHRPSPPRHDRRNDDRPARRGEVFGLIIALCEGWSAFVGFLYFAGNLTGLGNPLTNESPTSALGEAIDIVVSCWVLIFAGSAVGVIMHLNVVARLQRTLPLRGARGAAVLFGVAPGCVIGVAVAIGFALAAVEGWSLRAGFEYERRATRTGGYIRGEGGAHS